MEVALSLSIKEKYQNEDEEKCRREEFCQTSSSASILFMKPRIFYKLKKMKLRKIPEAKILIKINLHVLPSKLILDNLQFHAQLFYSILNKKFFITMCMMKAQVIAKSSLSRISKPSRLSGLETL